MQEENLSILRSLKPNIEEIVPPLEAAQLEVYGEDSERIQSGADFVMGELTMTALLLTGIDYEVADRERELLNNMRHIVFGYGISELKSSDYMDLCREFLRIYPNSLITVDRLPLSVRLLMQYDEKHDTEYASKARTIFIQFAEAIVKADKNENPVEAIVLENFKDTLNGS